MIVPEFAGSRVGRYDVLSLLGSGGMGAVYDAIDPALGRHVAVKILPTELAADRSRLARFVQEARAASALNHPNVVAIYEIGHEQIGEHQVHFIAMEKVDGNDLRSVLTHTRLPLSRAIDVVAQVADAIAAAHAAGIVHRDLKPENIMLSQTGVPKVLDFGLAKLQPGSEEIWSLGSATAMRSTDSGVILGTVGYMSPEQAQGGTADHRADIFSLGCILYEAVAGRRAFAAGSSVETLNAIINTEPAPLRDSRADTPPELQRIVSKAMAKRPDERYQSAKELAIDLRAMMRERSAPRSARTSAAMSRRTVLAAAAAAAVILTLATIAFVLQSRSDRVTATPVPSVEVRRITARGTVLQAALSPDGHFLAYTLLDQTMRLRQMATGVEIELVRIAPLGFWGLTFTPDGSSIVYAAKDPQKPVGSCFRVAAIGGRPDHLFDGIDSSPSVSPDGRRIAYVRAEHPRPGESALMVANIDGSGVRTVAVRRPPALFAPMFFTGPAWSPDGAWIASAVKRAAEPVASQLLLFNPESGAERPLLTEGWHLVTHAVWLPDGSGIVAAASKESNDPTRAQLWHIGWPGGAARRITTEGYRGVTVARQKDLLVSILIENNAQLWSVPLGSSGSPEKISTGRNDGFGGVTMTPDGRVVFTNVEDQVQTLVISSADGSGRARLTRDAFVNGHPAAFRDGIAYVSSTPRGTELCVTNFEGEGRRVLEKNVDMAPIALSSDATWVIFQRNRRLWKMPLRGGPPAPLTDEVSSAPAFSPSGDRIALLLGDSDTYGARASVLTLDGRPVWSTPLSGGVHTGSAMRWMPDATGLIVNSGPKGTLDDRNLWLHPFEGEPRPLTNFSDQRAYFWDLTPDGKRAVMARANLIRDAMLITGFR